MKHAAFAAILLIVLCSPGTGSAFARDQRYELLQAKEYDKAITECTRRIASGEGDRKDQAYSYWVRGFAHLAKNDRDRAVQDYSRAIELDPTPDRYYERGELHKSMSRYREAVDDFQKAAELYEAPHDARKDRYNAQMARVSAKTAGTHGRWDAWFVVLVLCAIAGYIFLKRRRSLRKKSAAWLAVSLIAALFAFLLVQRLNPFGWSMGFISLARTALAVAVFLGAASVAVLLFSFIWDGIKKRRTASAPVELPAQHEDGNSHGKARREAQSEGRRCCPRCGAAVFQMEDVRFCHKCGASVPGSNLDGSDSARGGG